MARKAASRLNTDKIGIAIGKDTAKYKMHKHFHLTVTDTTVS
jgi:hypothetical protein